MKSPDCAVSSQSVERIPTPLSVEPIRNVLDMPLAGDFWPAHRHVEPIELTV